VVKSEGVFLASRRSSPPWCSCFPDAGKCRIGLDPAPTRAGSGRFRARSWSSLGSTVHTFLGWEEWCVLFEFLPSHVPSKHDLIDGVTYVSTAYSCWQLAWPKVKHWFFDFVPGVMGFFGVMLQAGADYLREKKSG